MVIGIIYFNSLLALVWFLLVGMTLFHEYVQAAGAVTAAVANRVDLGDVQLPAGDWVITRVWAHSVTVGTHTANMGIHGYIQIESEDCGIEPCEFLLEPITGMAGTGPAGSGVKEPRKYVVNCKVRGGTTLHVYHVSDSTITTALSETIVTIEFARASPFPGPQVHMKCGEPGVAASTSDGGVVSLTAIEITASKLLAVVVYTAYTTGIGDASVQAAFEMKSADFKENGPQRWSLNVQPGGDATNTVPATTSTLLVEINAAFKVSNTKQNVTSEVTVFDAISTGPMCNWCLIYA